MNWFQPQSLELQCTENSFTVLETQMSFVKINAATCCFGTWKIEYHFKIKVPEISAWIMDEWWESDDGLCRPVSLWSLLHISLLIKNDLLSPLYTSRARIGVVGGQNRRERRRGCRSEGLKDWHEAVVNKNTWHVTSFKGEELIFTGFVLKSFSGLGALNEWHFLQRGWQ